MNHGKVQKALTIKRFKYVIQKFVYSFFYLLIANASALFWQSSSNLWNDSGEAVFN
jgi:hypothetical protein